MEDRYSGKIFEFDVYYGESAHDYPRCFKEQRDKFPCCDSHIITPENYPWPGMTGFYCRKVRLVRPGRMENEQQLREALGAAVQISPFDLLALCVTHPELGQKSGPLFSSLSAAHRKETIGKGFTILEKFLIMVSCTSGGRTLNASNDCGLGWSENCLFPVYV